MATPPYTVGWVYNLKSAPSLSDAQRVIAVAVIFSVISTIATVVRITIRIVRKFNFVSWDDIFIALSTLFCIGYSATAVYQTRWGLGLQVEDLPAQNVITFSKIEYTGGPQYCLAILTSKLSLLSSYIRFAGFNRTYASIIYVTIAMVVISQTIFVFLLSIACQPIAKQWDPSIPGTCLHTLSTYFALGGTSLVWDLLIMILPFPILKRLQLETGDKSGLYVLFSLGLFVTIIQGVRMWAVAKLAIYTESQSVIEWSIVEINLSVLVACIPTFRPLMRYFAGKGSRNSQAKATNQSRYMDRSGGSALDPPKRGGQLRSTRKSSIQKTELGEDEIELCVPGSDGHFWRNARTSKSMPDTRPPYQDSDYEASESISSITHGQQVHVKHEYTVQYEGNDNP